MDGQAIIAVSAAVVALVQLAKWSGVPDKYGPACVLVLAVFGVGMWAWSRGTYERAVAFDLFAGWIAVATSAAGVFGFTRAAREDMVKTQSPPSGAGNSPTRKAELDTEIAGDAG